MFGLPQDGFPGRYPDKGSRFPVILLHKSIDLTGEFSYLPERTAADGFPGHDAEAAFQLIDP